MKHYLLNLLKRLYTLRKKFSIINNFTKIPILFGKAVKKPKRLPYFRTNFARNVGKFTIRFIKLTVKYGNFLGFYSLR